MAVAGSGCDAYRVWLSADDNFKNLQVGLKKTIARSECVKPKDAVPILRKGQSVIVAGSDMMKLRSLLEMDNA